MQAKRGFIINHFNHNNHITWSYNIIHNLFHYNNNSAYNLLQWKNN